MVGQPFRVHGTLQGVGRETAGGGGVYGGRGRGR